MKLPVIRFHQGKVTLYQTTLKGGDLIDPAKAKVDVWDPTFEPDSRDKEEILKQGYQRKPITNHFRKVAKYLETRESPLLPTSVLLNARQNNAEKKLSFKALNEAGNVGILTIPSEALPLWIVDGQHRVYGLRHAVEEDGEEQLLEYAFPVTVVDAMDKVDEINQFRTINTTQKRVRPDLGDRLLAMLSEIDPETKLELVEKKMLWRTVVVEITRRMNERADSAWKGRIKKPNEKKPEAPASEAAFNTSLKPVIKSDVLRGYPTNEIVNMLIEFWNAVKELMPETFEDPRSYVIQKTNGLSSLHLIAPLILRDCIQQRDVCSERIKEILRKDSEHFQNPEFWRSGGDGAALYRGQGGFRQLADEMLEELGYSMV